MSITRQSPVWPLPTPSPARQPQSMDVPLWCPSRAVTAHCAPLCPTRPVRQTELPVRQTEFPVRHLEPDGPFAAYPSHDRVCTPARRTVPGTLQSSEWRPAWCGQPTLPATVTDGTALWEQGPPSPCPCPTTARPELRLRGRAPRHDVWVRPVPGAVRRGVQGGLPGGSQAQRCPRILGWRPWPGLPSASEGKCCCRGRG